MDRHARNRVRLAPGGDAPCQLAERLSNGGGGCPDRIFYTPPSSCKISQVFPGHDYPLRPTPILAWPPDPHIQDHPMQSSSADVGRAELMEHPRARHDKITRMQIKGFVTHHQVAGSSLKEN